MTTWVYLTSERTGTVHMADFDGHHTLCGRRLSNGSWIMGDETFSGIAATCGTCRRSALNPTLTGS